MKNIYAGYSAREKGNLQEAFECFQNALLAEKGSPIAAYEMALFYEQGDIVSKDIEKAHTLYIQAAEGCVEKAQAKLAEWYEKGIHVEKNDETAKFWRERTIEQQKAADEPPITLAESLRQKIAEIQNTKVPETND